MNITTWKRPRTAAEVAGIVEVGRAARASDGIDPFNEESHFALVRDLATGLAVVASDEDAVIGAAINADGEGTSWDLAVAPKQRRQGVASALLHHIAETYPNAGVWAHGGLDAAEECAQATGWSMGRDLWVMSRELRPNEEFDTNLPAGFTASTYDSSDEMAQEWLDINAASFASHPEQGKMTMADFRDRASQDWFDPKGLIFIRDDTTGAVAATNWIKREPGNETGEVYVVAVAPAYQGRGLAKPLTALGLAHLAAVGAHEIELYVEGDNEPAKATYTRAGFTRASHDVMYVYTPRLSE